MDFAARQASLQTNAAPAALLPHWKDGRVKQAVIARALRLRAGSGGLFTEGSYTPLRVEGPRADNILAFARVFEGRASITVATRLPAHLPGIGAKTVTGCNGLGRNLHRNSA